MGAGGRVPKKRAATIQTHECCLHQRAWFCPPLPPATGCCPPLPPAADPVFMGKSCCSACASLSATPKAPAPAGAPAPTTGAPAPPGCEDTNPQCTSWASRGECEKSARLPVEPRSGRRHRCHTNTALGSVPPQILSTCEAPAQQLAAPAGSGEAGRLSLPASSDTAASWCGQLKSQSGSRCF